MMKPVLLVMAGMTVGLSVQAAPVEGPDFIGCIVQVKGGAMISQGGKYVPATEGTPLRAGDRVMTLEGGKIQLRFADLCQYELGGDRVLDMPTQSLCSLGEKGTYQPVIRGVPDNSLNLEECQRLARVQSKTRASARAGTAAGTPTGGVSGAFGTPAAGVTGAAATTTGTGAAVAGATAATAVTATSVAVVGGVVAAAAAGLAAQASQGKNDSAEVAAALAAAQARRDEADQNALAALRAALQANNQTPSPAPSPLSPP